MNIKNLRTQQGAQFPTVTAPARVLPKLTIVSRARDQLVRITQQLPGGGETRPGQLTMTEKVEAAVKNEDTLLIEAGTGTGKSLAYLTPIIGAGKRAVVATATIALQGQLVDHDVPRVAEGLERDVSVAMLKGRGNYLCKQRLLELDRAKGEEQLQLLGGRLPSEQLASLRAWAASTQTGDREELDPAPPHEMWRAVSVGPDECPGAAKCPSGAECFSEAARNIAREADIIVTNHHYYGLNLATDGVLLPEHEVVVFDEAHNLPEVLGATCGVEMSGGRVRALARRVRGVLTDDELPLLLDRTAIELDNQLRDGTGQVAEMSADLVAALVAGRDRADRVLSALRKVNAKEDTDAAARVERAMISSTSLIGDFDSLIEADDNSVLWVDGSENNPVLKATPLEVGAILDEFLWPDKAVILTSATLPSGLAPQLGLPTSTDITRVGSPFDYPELGMLYCATHLPPPNASTARAAVAEEMATLINAAGGRTLGLFTSASAMREAAETLRETIDFPVLVQGENSRAALIEAFKDDPESVLLATLSFWQGVDLPGDTLTLVTVDRIPFPRPDEPVTQARRDRAGRHAFSQVDLPRAQILLAQAAGRLVRRFDDRGVVAILDQRLNTKKSYRWELINALPPLARTKDQAEVIEFLQRLNTEAAAAQ